MTNLWMHVAHISLHVPLGQCLMLISHLQRLPINKPHSPTVRPIFGSVQTNFAIKPPPCKAFSAHRSRAERVKEPILLLGVSKSHRR